MNEAGVQRDKETTERDKMLLRLLKTPPQPRPKRERNQEKKKPTRTRAKRARAKKP